MKERLNTLDYKRRDTIENMSVELVALGIFTSLNENDIRKLVTKGVEKYPIDIEYYQLKLHVIQQAMEMNQKQLQKVTIKGNKVINLDKLPKMNALLNEITETVQEFQIRRCCIVIDQMLEETNSVRFERLRETCVIETNNFYKIKPYLEEYISNKQKNI